jgi:signal transduction histidine kinase
MKPKILLIDDEEGIRKLLGISLRDAGYPVSIAIDGERGIELFQEESPEIVLTDIKMPGLDGIEVLRRIKAMSPDTEVIVITGHGEMELAIQSLQLDASDFVTKPIHDEALFVALRRAEEKLAWRRALKHHNETLKTKVREATEELKNLQKELLRSERLAATGQTVAGMAHAIKNILGGLKGGRFMVNKGLEIKEMKYLQDGWAMVERNIEKISQLTMDLLSFCKERDPEWEIVQPNDLIREVFELYRDQAAERGVRLKLDLDEKMEPLALDSREMYQVLANLVGNALDACTLGDYVPPEPETIICSRSLPEKKILLEIRDNGMGMSEEVRKKLFTIFFSTKGSRGTGLGLLLSHKIVQEHGGEIRVQSSPQQGAVFQVILPKRLLTEPAVPPPPA